VPQLVGADVLIGAVREPAAQRFAGTARGSPTGAETRRDEAMRVVRRRDWGHVWGMRERRRPPGRREGRRREAETRREEGGAAPGLGARLGRRDR